MPKTNDIEIVKTDLQIQEEIDAHKQGWVAQRVGLSLMYLLVLATVIGLFGNGPVSKNTQSSPQVTIESEKFYRAQARMPLKISAQSENGITVAFPSDYIKHFEVESIVPEPAENKFTKGNVEYSFDGTGKADITFYLVPQNRGTISGTVEVNDQDFDLDHYIYP